MLLLLSKERKMAQALENEETAISDNNAKGVYKRHRDPFLCFQNRSRGET